MSTNYVGVPFTPWWDESKTGPAPDCEVCGCSMVRTGENITLNGTQRDPGWECLSCCSYKPDVGGGK